LFATFQLTSRWNNLKMKSVKAKRKTKEPRQSQTISFRLDIWEALRVACASRKIYMREFVNDAVRDKLKRLRKPATTLGE